MKTFDKVAWALVAAVGALFLLVGCSGGGTSAETVKVEIPTTKAIAGLVRSTEGVATVIYNNTVVGEKLKLTIEEDREADAAKLVVEVPSKALLGVRGAARRPALEGRASSRPRSGHDGAWPSRASEDRQAESLDGALAILITDSTGNIIFVSVQASVDFSGSKPAVAIVEGGIVTPDSDSDGAPNWLEVHLQTNPNSASDVPTQAAIDGANETLTQGFADAIATGKTTTAGADPQAGTSTGEPISTTPLAATGEPNTTLTAKPGAFSKVNSVSFKFATDTGVKFECSLDGAEFAACASPLNLSALSEGRHTFKVRAVSATGTPDATPASHTWTVDTVIPAASISGLSATPVSSTSVTATLNCSEPNCAFLCSVDGSVLAGCNASHLMSGLKDGDHTLKVSAVDEAGNEQADPAVGTFKTDTTKPAAPDAVKVTVAQNAPGSQDQVSGSAAAVEGGAKLKVFEDGLLTALLGEATAKVDGSFDAINIGDNKGDSLDKVYLIQIDSAGNQSAVLSLANDKTPPGAPTPAASDQTSGSASFTNATTVNMTITGDTGASGWFLTEGTTPAPLATGWTATKPTTFTLSAVEGSHTVKAFIKDAAHNVSASASASITLDTAAPGNPTLTLKDGDCPSCSATNAVGINVTVGNDSGIDKWLVAEGQSTSPAEGASGWGAEPISVTLSAGEASKTVYVWIKDVAGNINAGPVSASIILDTSNSSIGTVTPTSTATASHVDSPFDLSATVTENGSPASGIASCEYSTNGGTSWAAASVVGSTCSKTGITCTDAASLSINIRSTDNAGNVGTGTAVGRTCDTTAPTVPGSVDCPVNGAGSIACAWSASTEGGSGGLTYRLSYDTDASGMPYANSATASVTNYTLSSVAAGNYFICVTAYDAVGNESACTEVKTYLTPNAANGAGHLKADGGMDYTSACANGPGSEGLTTPYGSALDSTNKRLFVADSGNNRILVFNLSASMDFTGFDRKADYVLGQPDFTTCASATTQAGLYAPYGVAYSGNKLFVVDNGNSRVVVYDVRAAGSASSTVCGSTATTGIANGMNASCVLGQANFTTGTAGTTQGTLKNPLYAAADGTNNKLFVSDQQNHRVMVYDIAAITDGENAVNVLGQADFTSGLPNRGGATNGNTLSTPVGVAVHEASGRLYVADRNNNRVLNFNYNDGIVNGENPDYVLGQALVTDSAAATTSAGMNAPFGVARAVEGAVDVLYVSDNLNNRVLRFDITAITNGENAVNVLGQANFTTSTAGTAADKLSGPFGLAIASNRLHVADGTNQRLTIFDVLPISDGEFAADGLGHLDTSGGMVFDSACANGPGPDGNSPAAPGGLAVDTTGDRLFVTDLSNHRVLVYNLSTSDDLTDREADSVLGQADFAHCTANRGGAVAANSLNAPQSLVYDGTNNRLYVADYSNNRVVVYDVTGIMNGEAAVNVLGQANLTSNGAATTQAGLSGPRGVALGGNNLYVGDNTNNRVTVYNVGDGITDGENAINEFGQVNFTTGTANRGTTTAINSLSAPSGMAVDTTNNRLFVGDAGNARVIVYNVGTITDGEDAVNVLGQTSFTGNAAATTRVGVSNPLSVSYLSNRLFVAEFGNNRVTVFDVTSITDGENAVNVIGQNAFTVATAGTTQSAFNQPGGVHVTSANKLWVTENVNNRILAFDVP